MENIEIAGNECLAESDEHWMRVKAVDEGEGEYED